MSGTNLQFGIDRRGVLIGAAALALAPGAANIAAAQPRAGFETFMALSGRLTGRDQPDLVVGRGLYEALKSRYPQLDGELAALADVIETHGLRAGDNLKEWLGAVRPDLWGVASQLVSGWYLGVIGDGWDKTVITYETALMYQPVADKVVLHSYCRGAPGSWAEPV